MGVNFALFSEHATRVELCLFEELGDHSESLRLELPERTDHVWHGYFPDLRPGQLYAYRVYGPFDPQRGQRFNPNKLLIDPYAKAVPRTGSWHSSLLGYQEHSADGDLGFDTADSAAYAPLGAVIDPAYSWGQDRPLRTPWNRTVIYEAHVTGLTKLHKEVPPELRGTFSGVASEPIIRHLHSLGVTALELMPIHQKFDEHHLAKKGLTNYWGYNTLSFFAPDLRFAAHPGRLAAVREFKTMVKTLHAAGIEVILDVVYNHTAEADHFGPTISYRGIDNRSYYRLSEREPRYHLDFTGCGNTLNMQHPRVLQLIMDSLRYWIEEMHVDGFRFDLASALARELHEVDKLGAFFDIIHQDPVISQVKLIAEPWDVGEGGYQVGNFPVLWSEWNGRYRDSIRTLWQGGLQHPGEVAWRLAGSSDLYQTDGRSPASSINFITCHDGFTLNDLVSYEHKHNESNREENRDGTDDNRSWNCGVEGPSEEPAIQALRLRQKKNLLSTLLLSVGVPMLSGGDELSLSKLGNNNTYCQDNELNWYQWELTSEEQEFLDFARELVSLRHQEPVLQRRRFLSATVNPRTGLRDLYWFSPTGVEILGEEWNNFSSLAFSMALLGGEAVDRTEHGERISGGSLFAIFNPRAEGLHFLLPQILWDRHWSVVFDTSAIPSFQPESRSFLREGQLVAGRSVILLRAAHE